MELQTKPKIAKKPKYWQKLLKSPNIGKNIQKFVKKKSKVLYGVKTFFKKQNKMLGKIRDKETEPEKCEKSLKFSQNYSENNNR